ncbi:MFS transporter [Fulvimarina endophytica]|uniref:Bcr/CflA family efflux transporter n=2 Tax=Fulvimarina endophytica TaxID=2293836 RepID=A0A371X122_9HYPH|nr:MFS transporter [Fulvimarina endophytica]
MLATLMIASAVSPLAINIFVPSMATIAASLETDGATVGLGLSLYLFAVAILQIVAGPLSDRFGRRPVIIGGMVLFLLGTLLCLFASSILWFLLGRVIQAASATGIALSRAAVRDVYSRERSAAMIGYVTMGMAVAPMVGPAVGGFMDTLFGWQSVFWLLLGLGLVALAFILLDLNETNPDIGRPFTEQLSNYGKLFSERSFWLYAGAGAFITGSFFGFLGGATFISVELLGLTPAEYGLWFILCPLGYMIGNFVTGRISERVGIKRMMVIGSTLTVVSTLMILAPIVAGYLGAHTLFGPMLLLGIGNGMTLPSATAGGVSVRPDAAGAAAGLLGSSQIGVGAVVSTLAASMATGAYGATSLAIIMVVVSLAALACSLLAPRVSK